MKGGGASTHPHTFRHNAFHTDEVAKVTGSHTARGDVLSSEAALKTNMELLKLLPIAIVYSQHELLHSSLEGQDLQLSIVQESEIGCRETWILFLKRGGALTLQLSGHSSSAGH